MSNRAAVLIETDLGFVTVDLAPTRAGENFAKLCKCGYYANTLFYSVVPGFVAQGGGFHLVVDWSIHE
jgi:cyclophilin family peptidyl-prolyl cis-trans isomerase